MLCSNPFIRVPVGVDKKVARFNFEAKDAITPYGCGHCLACRKHRARVWAHRLMLEASCHVSTIFVTLTYSDENLPVGGSLNPRDLTLFMKRYRERIKPRKVRYFNVGEYGSRGGRPHYHLMIFNGDLLDEALIQSCWPLGFVEVSWFNEKRANYICKYVVKGLGKKSELLGNRQAEFMRCSKMGGGLGKAAVEGIAKRIKESGKEDLVEDLSRLQYGKTRKPLGRYLTHFLEELFPTAKQGSFKRYTEYQDSLVEQLGPTYRDNIMKPFEGQRIRISEMEKFFRKDGSI